MSGQTHCKSSQLKRDAEYCKSSQLERTAEKYIQVTGHMSMKPGAIRRRLAYENYRHNITLEDQLLRTHFPERWITDQSKLSELKFGIRDMAYAGCEIIAVYNALLFKAKQPKKLSELILQCELTGLDRFAGQWGTDVYRLGELLQENHLSYAVISHPEELVMNRDSAYVLSFWNTTNILHGIHTVFFVVKGTNKIAGYNDRYSAKPTIYTGTFLDILQMRPFVIGYRIIGDVL